MKAQSLSINLAGPCQAKCPFCISRATWKTGIKDNDRLLKRLPLALKYARYHGVDTVLVTGSGEPTLLDCLPDIISEIPVSGIPLIELQTNGAVIQEQEDYLTKLVISGLTTLCISIASHKEDLNSVMMGLDFSYWDLIKKCKEAGILCRISLNLSLEGDGQKLENDLGLWADSLKEAGAHQLTLRHLGVPEQPQSTVASRRAVDWVKTNEMDVRYYTALNKKVSSHTPLRDLPYGARVYDYHGLSMVVTTCMTNNMDPNDIRSLILQPDGHVYHSWDYQGSILL